MILPRRRDLLSALLDAHSPADDKERADLERMRALARTLPEPFSRHQLPGYFTGSAVVVDGAAERILYVLHRRLGRWLQPGGHSELEDGGFLELTALREAQEETGCRVVLHPSAPRPLDVDVHPIPPKKGEPPHEHFDVRFLVVAVDPESAAHDPAESHECRWFEWEEAERSADDEPLRRLLRKARQSAR